MATLAEALTELNGALARPTSEAGAAGLRKRIRRVRDALQREPVSVGDAWLAARSSSLRRDQARLLRRLGAVDPADDRVPMQRLMLDLEHHRQRVSDLVYDGVSMELGGSE